MTLAGRPYAPSDPLEARTLGVAMIYQELTLRSALDRRTEHHARPGAAPLRHRRSRRDARARPSGRWHGSISPSWIPTRPVVDAVAGGAPARRDRPCARGRRPRGRHGRADQLAVPPRGRAPVRRHRAPARARRRRSSISATFSRKCDRSRSATPCCATAAAWSSGQVSRHTDDAAFIPRIIEAMAGRSIAETYPRLPHEQGDAVLELDELCGTAAARRARG